MEGKGTLVQRSPNLFHVNENEIFLTFFLCPPLSGGLVTRVEGVRRLIHGPAWRAQGIRTDKVVKSGGKKKRGEEESRRKVWMRYSPPSPWREIGIRVGWLADILITDWPRGLIKS